VRKIRGWKFGSDTAVILGLAMRESQSTTEFCLLTVNEAAERLSCKAANVYALVASGELPVVRVGLQKGYRIDIRDLDAFVGSRKFRYKPEVSVRVPRVKFKHLRA
jgi:excisionase family DNA binding protein